ncbi:MULTISPECIES: hypothetical protein [Aurantimonas]|uniref:hypothetical protein n=1 Tax=Aurantimonas TaxID=182269 RepID=UPI00165D5811
MTFFSELLYGVRDTSLIEASSVKDFFLQVFPEHGYPLDDEFSILLEESDELFDRAKLTVRENSTGYQVVDPSGMSLSASFLTPDAARMHGDAIRILIALDHLAETVTVRMNDEEATAFTELLGIEEGRHWISQRKSADIQFVIRPPAQPPQSPADIHRQSLVTKKAVQLRPRRPSDR